MEIGTSFDTSFLKFTTSNYCIYVFQICVTKNQLLAFCNIKMLLKAKLLDLAFCNITWLFVTFVCYKSPKVGFL